MIDRHARRRIVHAGLTAVALVPVTLLLDRQALAQAAPLDPNDTTAKALAYVPVSSQPGQRCDGCAQFQGKPGDARAGCTLFAGKTVPAAAWCKGWSKKA